MGVAFSKAAFAMRYRLLFSFLVLPTLVPRVLPQTSNSAQQAALKSKSESTKWTKLDERLLLARAQQGDTSSQMWLASGYEQGWFGKANFSEALKWYRRSAEKGNPDAQNELGRMYEDGEGVTQNYSLAAKWYRKAAEQIPDLGGAGQGRNNLGMLCLYGRGVPQDYVQAYTWFRLSDFGSNPNLALAKARMTAEQIVEAERLVKEWKGRRVKPQ
jgi:TPR repeat protein